MLIQPRSVTLVGEADRKMLKAAIKHSAGEDQVRHRLVPPDTVAKFVEKLESLKGEMTEIMEEEREEKQVRGGDVPRGNPLIDLQLRQAEMELKKGQNLLEHGDEIYSRPARTWFQSEEAKQQAKGTLVVPRSFDY